MKESLYLMDRPKPRALRPPNDHRRMQPIIAVVLVLGLLGVLGLYFGHNKRSEISTSFSPAVFRGRSDTTHDKLALGIFLDVFLPCCQLTCY